MLPAAPTDSQEANGCFQLDREMSGRVQVDVFLLGGQYIRAQALPSESLVMEKSFRVDSWWEEVGRIAEVSAHRRCLIGAIR